MGTAPSKTPVLQYYASGKAFPRLGSEWWQILPVIQIWMLRVCAKIVHCTFLLLDAYGRQITPLLKHPTKMNWKHLLIKVYEIITLNFWGSCSFSIQEPWSPNAICVSVSVLFSFFIDQLGQSLEPWKPWHVHTCMHVIYEFLSKLISNVSLWLFQISLVLTYLSFLLFPILIPYLCSNISLSKLLLLTSHPCFWLHSWLLDFRFIGFRFMLIYIQI